MENMKKFAEWMAAMLEQRLNGYEVNVIEYEKAQYGKTVGLQLVKEGQSQNAVPVFPVNDLYVEYTKGTDIDDLLAWLWEGVGRFLEESPKPFEVITDFSFENIRDKLSFRVLNTERNAEYLNGVPHKDLGNGLSAVFTIVVSHDERGVAQSVITNDLAANEGYNMDDVHDAALQNAEKIDPAELVSLEELFSGRGTNYLKEGKRPAKDGLYTLRNASGVQGSTTLFYPGVKEKIGEFFEAGYYAIPSSVHEFIIVPENGNVDPDALLHMLTEGNSTLVGPEDVFSGDIYRYNPEKDRLEIAATSVAGGGLS